jgi:hypothetical protein
MLCQERDLGQRNKNMVTWIKNINQQKHKKIEHERNIGPATLRAHGNSASMYKAEKRWPSRCIQLQALVGEE